MLSWRRQATILIIAMFFFTFIGLYGAYHTMILTTLRTEYDFVTVRFEDGALKTNVLGVENSFASNKLDGIKDFFREALNYSRWQEYMDKSGYFR